MNEQASGRNRGSFTQHRLSLKGCSPAEPLYVSPDATKIIDGLEIQLSKSSFLSNEWGVLYSEIFSNEEIALIIKHIQQEEESIKQESIEHEKKMEQMRKNLGI